MNPRRFRGLGFRGLGQTPNPFMPICRAPDLDDRADSGRPVGSDGLGNLRFRVLGVELRARGLGSRSGFRAASLLPL